MINAESFQRLHDRKRRSAVGRFDWTKNGGPRSEGGLGNPWEQALAWVLCFVGCIVMPFFAVKICNKSMSSVFDKRFSFLLLSFQKRPPVTTWMIKLVRKLGWLVLCSWVLGAILVSGFENHVVIHLYYHMNPSYVDSS